MNEITVMYQDIDKKEWEDNLFHFLNLVLEELSIDNWEFSVIICSNKYIQEINKNYRDKDKPTDVITFVMSDEPFPSISGEEELYSAGDIIVSLEMVKENSLYFKVNEDEELKRVLIHGILHLKGLDHETNGDEEEMLIIQEQILSKFPNEGIYR